MRGPYTIKRNNRAQADNTLASTATLADEPRLLAATNTRQ